MVDFVVDIVAEVVDFVLDLWINKITARFKK